MTVSVKDDAKDDEGEDTEYDECNNPPVQSLERCHIIFGMLEHGGDAARRHARRCISEGWKRT
jgi:hypothetical protein